MTPPPSRRRIALFGSWARGEETTASDVDILVDVAPSIGLDFVTLADDLERLLGRKIDLVSTRAIRPALWAEIEPELIDAWAAGQPQMVNRQ